MLSTKLKNDWQNQQKKKGSTMSSYLKFTKQMYNQSTKQNQPAARQTFRRTERRKTFQLCAWKRTTPLCSSVRIVNGRTRSDSYVRLLIYPFSVFPLYARNHLDCPLLLLHRLSWTLSLIKWGHPKPLPFLKSTLKTHLFKLFRLVSIYIYI